MQTFKARKLVVGIGSKPYLPCNAQEYIGNAVLHAADYMYYRPEIIKSNNIAVIGSGQSAAEIFYDLLHQLNTKESSLNWYTRSDRFYAMEHSKLNYEMTSPDYIDFFYQLDQEEKQRLLRNQATLYKGINHQLINAVYDRLYSLFTEGHQNHIKIQAHAELKSISTNKDAYNLEFYHNALRKIFTTTARHVILATGYTTGVPVFLNSLNDMIQYNIDGSLKIKRNYALDNADRVFIQNAEMHTMGLTRPTWDWVLIEMRLLSIRLWESTIIPLIWVPASRVLAARCKGVTGSTAAQVINGCFRAKKNTVGGLSWRFTPVKIREIPLQHNTIPRRYGREIQCHIAGHRKALLPIFSQVPG